MYDTMITIQRYVHIESNEVIISVGYLQGGEALLLDEVSPEYVIAYDPHPKIYERYKEHEEMFEWFEIRNVAVGGRDGRAFLKDRKTRSNLLEGSEGDIEVEVVSMTNVINDVYKRFGRINRLLINCEGAEIDIVKRTSMDTFRLCNFMFIQFHSFCC